MASTPVKLTLEAALSRLNELADPAAAAGMARYGIRPARALGVSIPALRALARGQRSHELALQLWDTGIHEARILASMVDNPAQVDRAQMDRWAADFDSWDVCDQVCSNLFDRTPHAAACALAWSLRQEEYVRRAGFTLMACMAVHRPDLPDDVFRGFFPLMVRCADDERNYVRKAVNWALRQIGKRRPGLYDEALRTAGDILAVNTPTARWIANDALRELRARALKPDS